ncbi:MAG TPA: isoprenylcysteine carboxylmethyltransferase family protein [Thermoleophilia bacterium]|nr:isoprenylcysteine carboxylmethyltransferase family protein [Thermoleophilia bacterium]
MRRLAVLPLVTAALAVVSRRSLRDPRSHGFSRFFGFLALAALVLTNAPWWFRRPLCARQLVSWGLLVSSAGLAAHSFRVLRAVGAPDHVGARDERRSDEPALLAFEKTTVLVDSGAYGLIRHPLYASLLLLVGGALLKRVSPPAAALAVAASACFVATALAEEPENRRTFGEEYAEYRRRTHLFVPYVL